MESSAEETPVTNDENDPTVSFSKCGRKRTRTTKEMPSAKLAPPPVTASPPPPPYQCPMAGFHLCPHCGDVKKVKCRKAECKAKSDATEAS